MDKEKPPFDGPYTKTTNTIKDKSGAKHTPASRARHLAKMAMQQQQKKKMSEEVRSIKKTPSDDQLHKTLSPTKNRSQGVKALMKTHDMSRSSAKKHINRLMNILAKEETKLDEALKPVPAHRKAAAELSNYSNKHGGVDKKDIFTASKHIYWQRHDELKKHLKSMDTDPRDKVLSVMKKHGLGEEVQEGAYSEKDIEDAERAKNPGMSSKKPAPQPEKKKEIKEFDAVKNFLNSFKRSSTMFKDDNSNSPPKTTATKPASTPSGSKVSFSGFSRGSTINKG